MITSYSALHKASFSAKAASVVRRDFVAMDVPINSWEAPLVFENFR